MRETNDYAERRTRARLAEIEDGERSTADVLEVVEADLELRLRATVSEAKLLPSTSRAARTSTTAISTARSR
jgi:hypothetical protein